MKTAVRLEVGDLAHTWEIPMKLTPDEQKKVLQALCQLGRTLQLWLEGIKVPPSSS